MFVIKLIIHRGANQIGGSCIELSTEKSRIILEIGEELPQINDEIMDKEPVLPKVKGLYSNNTDIDAIFVSHGHSDHAGLIGYTNPFIPLYIGEKTHRILNITAIFTGNKPIQNPIHYLVSGEKIAIGDFLVIPYLVDHSGFDSYAFVIYVKGKVLVYTGDFRDHGRKSAASKFFIDNIPTHSDLLIIEGTMMGRENETVKSEGHIEDEVYNVMKSKNAPVLVLQSATNIDRLVSMYRGARRSGRIMAIDIFTAHIVAQLQNTIPKPGTFEDVRVFYPYFLTKRMFETPGGGQLMKEFSKYKISKKDLSSRNDYCLLIRDTMLLDIKRIEGLEEASFIYSMWDGYKKTIRTSRMLEFINRKSMDIYDIHTSGHASIGTIRNLIEKVKPLKTIPIHTENPDLFAQYFKNIYLAQDGESIFI